MSTYTYTHHQQQFIIFDRFYCQKTGSHGFCVSRDWEGESKKCFIIKSNQVLYHHRQPDKTFFSSFQTKKSWRKKRETGRKRLFKCMPLNALTRAHNVKCRDKRRNEEKRRMLGKKITIKSSHRHYNGFSYTLKMRYWYVLPCHSWYYTKKRRRRDAKKRRRTM